MKYLLLIVSACFLSCYIYAQQKFNVKVLGTFTLPETEKYVTLKFDFSETVFEKKYNEADWALLNGNEEWEKAKKEALETIVEKMNEKMTKTRIIMILETMGDSNNSVKSNYTMYIAPISLDRKGKNESLFILVNNETGENYGATKMRGFGGHFGSLGNLLGQGYKKAAPAVALELAKQNKNKK